MYTEWCRLHRGGSENHQQQEIEIIDIYREKSLPENWTLWHHHRDCQRSGQQALRFDILNSFWEVVGESGEEAKAIESADKKMQTVATLKNLKYKIYLSLFNTFLVTTLFHMCYYIALMSSLLFYIVEPSKNKENPLNEKVCPNFWLVLYVFQSRDPC